VNGNLFSVETTDWHNAADAAHCRDLIGQRLTSLGVSDPVALKRAYQDLLAGVANSTLQNILTTSWETATANCGREDRGQLLVDLKAR
jgi:lambda repressor-like predicted transcriptional regulator